MHTGLVSNGAHWSLITNPMKGLVHTRYDERHLKFQACFVDFCFGHAILCMVSHPNRFRVLFHASVHWIAEPAIY